MRKIISYSNAQISKKDTALVAQAMRNGWGKNSNKYVNLFEKKFLKENKNFKIDKTLNGKLIFSSSYNGYLKKIR